MIYLSIGVLQDNLTKEKCVVKCGSRVITLTGKMLYVWLQGKMGFAECEFDETIKDLDKHGLIVLGEENTYNIKYNMFLRCLFSSAKSNKVVEMNEDERTVYQWLRFSPLILDITDVLSLFERNLKFDYKFIGKSNGQALVELILKPHGNHKDELFYNRMYYSEKRNDLVDIFTSLLEKGRLILIGRKDCYA